MRSKLALLLMIMSLSFGCSGPSKESRVLTTQYGSIKALQAHLEKDKMTWWTYHKGHIILSTEFNPLDTDGAEITKRDFLEKLNTGDFIAVEVEDESKQKYYQLLAISENADTSISGMVEVDGYTALEHFLQEGRDFPDYEFIDLDGNYYARDDLLGKTVFLKTWFIACAPCIEEMPDLNELVKAYQNREDIIFISLALDKAEALKAFLQETQFDYKVIPLQGDFIDENLVNLAYPTHYLIGPDGKVKKVTHNFEELDLARVAMGI
ncbi:TlpA disulfide reductase family protein [Roseivirga sp. E12]|uniref:TlpA family protein disulfide reductase n=1 Tax=Roseivirga sp. E12 TaxID=2819237 RepID=UPI001ABD14B4|nr:TlpA disulfide reductase family protein [Roseivirga sp. E12]MBO3696966.1 TlpA family protein disulfide reductase [Roseivirga sp. E12]